jgi:hypothetical protein
MPPLETPAPPHELVGADRVLPGGLDRAAAFVARLMLEPGRDILVADGQLELGEDLVVPGHPDAFEMDVVRPLDAGTVWAIDGGSCVVADARAFNVVATRAARVRFAGGATDRVDSPPIDLLAVSGHVFRELARASLTELLGHEPEQIPELLRPVDALREWAEWRAVRETVSEASPGDLILVDGSLHGGPLVPGAVVRRVHHEALERGVSLAGVVKASTLYWGRHAPLVALLKRRGDRELPHTEWAARISSDPIFARLYIGDILVAHLAPTASRAFRVDVARGPAEPAEVLGRLAGLARDPAFVGYPYPLARAHQAARITGYAVADVRRAFRDALSRNGLSDDDVEMLFQDFHEVLDR